MNLYFIAVIPDPVLRAKVRSLKEEMKTQYGAKHALKSPAHITLQMPFRRMDSFESEMKESLREFCAEQQSFSILLNGFGAFRPRVIYINITNHDPLVQLHRDLGNVLVDRLGFTPREINRRFHPHMTIATRDLKEKAFNQAWPLYDQREFKTQFDARSISLLKHNGKYWDIFDEFLFKDSHTT